MIFANRKQTLVLTLASRYSSRPRDWLSPLVINNQTLALALSRYNQQPNPRPRLSVSLYSPWDWSDKQQTNPCPNSRLSPSLSL